MSRKRNKCDRLWKNKEQDYLKKDDGSKEWATEKRAWYCNGKKIIPRTQKFSEADEYDTDEQMQELEKLNKK